jgi:hypothetical protein
MSVPSGTNMTATRINMHHGGVDIAIQATITSNSCRHDSIQFHGDEVSRRENLRPNPRATIEGLERRRFFSQSDATHRRIYRASAKDCIVCAIRAQCTTAPRGRWIGSFLHETYVERMHAHHETEAFATVMRKRKVWIEPCLAKTKEWHGLRRFRLRGAEKVNIRTQFIAAGDADHGRVTRPG